MTLKKRAWTEINLDALANNMKNIREYVCDGTEIMAVVKADAYGHGYCETAEVLLNNGADRLAVACIDEAIQLRKSGFSCPILILGYTDSKYAQELVTRGIIPSCYSYEFARAMSKAAVKLNKKAVIHIKIDSGMSRIGLRYTEDESVNRETIDTILKMAVLPGIEIEGIFTHFSVADDNDDEYTKNQFNRFKTVCDRLKGNGLDIPVKHCCNSAALIRFREMHMDMVRPGIILYGHKPSDFVDCGRLHLKPVMEFKAKVIYIKELEPDTSISYGRKYKTDCNRKIATIAVGYADGYSRILSGKAKVIAGGKLCDVVGNICMDQCMIDVTDVNNIAIGDDVILFGKSDDIELPVENLAEKMGTISYEILCNIGKRIPRIFMRGGIITDSHSYLFDPPVKVGHASDMTPVYTD